MQSKPPAGPAFRLLALAVIVSGVLAPAAAADELNKTPLARKAAAAALSTTTAEPAQGALRPGYTRTRYEIPITIYPGANINKLTSNNIPKPPGNVYLVRMNPNLVIDDGDSNPSNDRVPRTDVVHLHHMVWIVQDPDSSRPQGFNLPFGAGEEKTIAATPDGFGYPVYSNQKWIINDMLHNLTPATIKAKIVYTLDWTPMDSDLGKTLTPVYPLWLDVKRGSGYPVFDTFTGMGSNGTVTFPDQFSNPYPGRPSWAIPSNWTANRHLTLVGTAGHVHPGGLRTDLQVVRSGAGSSGPQPGTVPNSARLFRSNAVYWDPAGPISWDMAMEATPANWRVHVRPGDTLRISATYETLKGDWYESMGIMVVWAALDSTAGADPFTQPVGWNQGQPTHGSYEENKNYGGKITTLKDPRKQLRGVSPSGRTIQIKDFVYQYGDLSLSGTAGRPPVVKKGQSLTFVNRDSGTTAGLKDIYHSITDCAAPCNKDTGLSYPLANGPRTFDSGQLGYGWPTPGTAAAQRLTWQTPSNLSAGTYTYFCRVHPFMRGAFRVVN